MHLKGTNLDFKGLSGAANQRGMQGLIHICLRHGNIILESAGNRFVHFMNYAQRRITVLYRIHDNPHRKQIINLVQRLMLVFHFLIDTEKVFYTPIHLCFNPGTGNVLADLIHNALNVLFSGTLAHGNLIHQIIIDIRFQIF